MNYHRNVEILVECPAEGDLLNGPVAGVLRSEGHGGDRNPRVFGEMDKALQVRCRCVPVPTRRTPRSLHYRNEKPCDQRSYSPRDIGKRLRQQIVVERADGDEADPRPSGQVCHVVVGSRSGVTLHR